jgi:tetratricopeptide (TPR) repeat protein
VLLYELLTGTTPLERSVLRQAGLLEALRLVREAETPRPSTRLSTTDELSSVAANRGLEPKKLSGLVRGELDWMVMKALEKDRNLRYETANGFAADVQRYLADEPVLACPPSAAYRLRKFVRRNRGRLVFAAGVCVLVAAVLGSIGWAVRDRAVREEEKQREQAARQARAANELALALDRAELFQGQGKRAEALSALERAELLAAEAPADSDLGARLAAVKERLAAEARDQEFVARIDDIRLRVEGQVEVQKSHFTDEAAIPAIQEGLRRYRVAHGMMAPAQAAAYIRGRPEAARRALITALDECLRVLPPGEAEARPWLFATLDAADTDAWRVQMRKAYHRGNVGALAQMARAVDVREQPPSSLLFAASCLSVQGGATWLEFSRRIQRAYPADFWANYGLASALAQNGQPAEAVRYYTATLALRPNNPGIYLNRGLALQDAGEVDAAIADYRQSFALAPQYAEPHNNLGNALWAKGRLDEAIDEYREAIRLKKDLPQAHYNLGRAMVAKGRPDEAIAEYHKAVQFKMDYAEAHNNLGNALQAKGRLDEAIAAYYETIRIKKDLPQPHYGLGTALLAKGRQDEAIAKLWEAIRLKKDYPEAHTNLGMILHDKGLLDEAIAEYRAAIRIKADLLEAHINLGNALWAKGKLDEAIAEYREALRINKGDANAHYSLGNALRVKGLLDKAIDEYREAIRLKKDYAEAHCNLSYCLRQKGQFREALEEARRGHELGSRNSGWRYPSAQWVRQCERLVELDGRLPGILEGKTTPASPRDGIELAGICSLKRLNRAAIRFYEGAFAADPKLLDDLGAAHRYKAACAAALAGCGQGQDADKLNDKERARLRRQALDWLRADLEGWGRLLDRGQDKDRPIIVEQLRHWLADTDFTGVRGPAALAKLPEAERPAWQKLWGDVAETLARVQTRASPEKKSGKK